MKTIRVTGNDDGEWSGDLVELAREGSFRQFEYHGTNFNAVVSAQETGNNADRMTIRLVTEGQECSGTLIVEGCWERSEFFAFMRNLASQLDENAQPAKKGPF